MTDPGEFIDLFEGLPREICELVELVQGLMIHVFWAERYGVRLSKKRRQEVKIRIVSKKLERIVELDNRPLTMARSLEKRLVGNCRDFSTLLCAMLVISKSLPVPGVVSVFTSCLITLGITGFVSTGRGMRGVG